jgi:hypothetical protein
MPSKAEMGKLTVPLLDSRLSAFDTYFPKCPDDAAGEEEERNPRSQMASSLLLQCLHQGVLHPLLVLLVHLYHSFPPSRPWARGEHCVSSVLTFCFKCSI